MLEVLFKNKKIFQISQKWGTILIIRTIENRIDWREWFRIRDKSIGQEKLKTNSHKLRWYYIIIIIITTERKINIRIIIENKI